MAQLQDWGNESGGARNKFGLLSIFQNTVRTKAGASYTMPGIIGKDGKPYEFKGKHLWTTADDVEASKSAPYPQGNSIKSQSHIILVLEATNSQGETYQAVRDDLSFSTAMQLARASLIDVFGPTWLAVFSNGARIPVQVEEAATGDKTNTGKDKTTFKLIKRFDTVDAMKAAEADYFKRFRPTSPAAANDNGIPADVMYSANAFWKALGGNESMFRMGASQDPKLSMVDIETLLAAVKAQPQPA